MVHIPNLFLVLINFPLTKLFEHSMKTFYNLSLCVFVPLLFPLLMADILKCYDVISYDFQSFSANRIICFKASAA